MTASQGVVSVTSKEDRLDDDGRPRVRCQASRHGTSTAYKWNGCRCEDARESQRVARIRYRKRRYLNRGPLLVDSTGVLRRLQALRRLGWSLRDLGAELGMSGQRVDQLTGLIHVDLQRRIVEMYERLSMTHGPSPRAARYAEKRGWPPPLAWDDDEIDNPDARPRSVVRDESWVHVDDVAVEETISGNRRPHLSREERREVVRRMDASGKDQREIAMRLGVKVNTAERLRHRVREAS